ncbi:MAG TPA: carboxypeptidase regulatory-like domain-containing protein [Terriglobia bacterium]|nr:carboxypeptidase regulatory-like domain-containing protein [Terriglobia bacterium]
MRIRVVFLIGALVMAAGALRAQQDTASIRGTVTDPSGARVARAQVAAIQLETGLSRRTQSDGQGSYLLVLLPIGHYQVEATAPGFKKSVQEGLSLSVNEVAVVPVQLAVGGAQQTVEVRSDATLVQTTNDLGETIGQQDILDLPLNGRNFSQLGLLLPGAAPLTQGLQVAGGSLRGGQSYAVNGQRPESNQFLIDGAENYNSVNGGFVLRPPPDAIAEFRILTNTASAEFGHNSGSNTSIVTRSGSNRFHGDVYEFLRNDALDARNFFSQKTEPLKQNQFGGTLGGPIRRDKTFFFGYYEGFRNRQGETLLTTVPTAAERQGDFSALCSSYSPQGFCTNPTGTQLVNVFAPTPQPIPFNTLPGALISPVSQNLLALYPLPNTPNYGPNAYGTTQELQNTSDQFGLRIDHYLSTRDTFSFHYLFNNGSQVDPLPTSGSNVPGFPVGEGFRAQNPALEETHTFSPSVVNVARFSFLRNKFLFGQAVNHTTPASLGFQYSPTLPVQAGLPFIEVGGYASVGNPITGPADSYQNSFSFADSVAWVHGKHDLKFGGQVERDQVNNLMGIASNGFFVFAPVPIIGNAFADFMIGQPVVFLQGGGELTRGLRALNENLYAQDSYKPTPRLTLNIGLRYELPQPYSEVHNQTALFEPGAQSKVIPSAPQGLLYPGDAGVGPGLIAREYTAFAPRVGLAWDPTGNGRWAVRAAYGIFYDPYYNGQGGPLQTPESAPPWFKTIQESFPTFANPVPPGPNPFAPVFNGAQGLTLLTLDPNLRLPYAQDWNFTVERSFGESWLASVGYVGTKGTKLPRFIEGDPAVLCSDLPLAQQSSCISGEQQNVNLYRPYSGCTPASPASCNYGSIGLISGIANSDYNALQASLRKRLGHGLAFLASYTYSKTLDDVSSFNISGSSPQLVAGENDLAQNPRDLAAEYGRSLFDARHRLVLSYEWQLPFWREGRGWYQRAFGNWQMNGIFSASTGTPFTVYDSSDPSLQGQAPEISGFVGDRPNLLGNPNDGPKTAGEWFNTQAFQRAPIATFGDAGRNIVQAAGLAQWDCALFKGFRLGESTSLQFRAEMFNISNRVNFAVPNDDFNSPTFGQVQSALAPRQIQFALKLLF